MAFEAFEHHVQTVTEFVRNNEAWAVPVVAALAFGESLAFISLLIPAWGALLGIGALIGMSGIDFMPIWIAASLGAALGDWLSFWIGWKFHASITKMWPLSRYPDLIPPPGCGTSARCARCGPPASSGRFPMVTVNLSPGTRCIPRRPAEE